jgi:hypothetical protein
MVAAAVTAAVAVMLLGAPAVAAALSVAPAPPAPPAGVRAARLVVVGAAGLRWDDIGAGSTPALWGLARTGSVAAVAARSLRASACPADGWLAFSAGARAADLVGAGSGQCRTLRDPDPSGLVPGWADYRQSARTANYAARPGLLGAALAGSGVRATGIGPGAAVALADLGGQVVGTYVRRPVGGADLTAAVTQALTGSPVVVVDVGTVREPGQPTADRFAPAPAGAPTPGAGERLGGGPARSVQVTAVDARVGAVLQGVQNVGADVSVLVVSLADSGTSPRLQFAAATGPVAGGPPVGGARFGGGLLESRSTRQGGYVEPADLTATVLVGLGLRARAPAGALVGAPLTGVPGPGRGSARVAAMVDEDRHAGAVRTLTGPFFTVLIAINLALYVLVTLGLNGAVLTRLGTVLDWVLPGRAARGRVLMRRPAVVLAVLRVAGVAVASIPVASFLANLSPWWRARPAALALGLLIAGWVAVVTWLALVPRWKSWLLGPVAVVAAVTAAVIAADIATGAQLQISAPMGVQPLVGARFYGFNNQAFALFAASAILFAVAVANPLVRRGRRRPAAVLVAVIGAVAVALDGLPGVGADGGGPPALVPAFLLLALLAAGVRISWWKAVGVLASGALVVISFAVLDWLRPVDSQTHLGRFVQTVLDGGAGPVLTRKAAANIQILVGNPLTVLAIAGVLLVVLVLGRPLRTLASAPDGGPFGWLSAGAPLTQLGTDTPLLRPGLIALAVALGLGFALNDSGVVIPAVGVTVAVPLLVAACASWMLRVRPGPAPTLQAPTPT